MFLLLPKTNSGAQEGLHGKLSHCVAKSIVGGLIRGTGDGGRDEDARSCAAVESVPPGFMAERSGSFHI